MRGRLRGVRRGVRVEVRTPDTTHGGSYDRADRWGLYLIASSAEQAPIRLFVPWSSMVWLTWWPQVGGVTDG